MLPSTLPKDAVMCLKNVLKSNFYKFQDCGAKFSTHRDVGCTTCTVFLHANITFMRRNGKGKLEKYDEINNYFIASSDVLIRTEPANAINLEENYEGTCKEQGRSLTKYLYYVISAEKALEARKINKEFIDNACDEKFINNAYDNMKWQEQTIVKKGNFIEQILQNIYVPDEGIKLSEWPGSSIKIVVESVKGSDGSKKNKFRWIDVMANGVKYCLDENMLEYIAKNSNEPFLLLESGSCYKNLGDKKCPNIESYIFLDAFAYFMKFIFGDITYLEKRISMINYLKCNAKKWNPKAVFSIFWDISVCFFNVINTFLTENYCEFKCFAGSDGQLIKQKTFGWESYKDQPAVMVFTRNFNPKPQEKMIGVDSVREIPSISSKVFILDPSLSKHTFPFFKSLTSQINGQLGGDQNTIQLINRLVSHNLNSVSTFKCSCATTREIVSSDQSVNVEQN